jgi:hypothetical protein
MTLRLECVYFCFRKIRANGIVSFYEHPSLFMKRCNLFYSLHANTAFCGSVGPSLKTLRGVSTQQSRIDRGTYRQSIGEDKATVKFCPRIEAEPEPPWALHVYVVSGQNPGRIMYSDMGRSPRYLRPSSSGDDSYDVMYFPRLNH